MLALSLRQWFVIFCAFWSPVVLTSCSSSSSSPSDPSSVSNSTLSPSAYSAYTGTDPKPSPFPPPDLGPANSMLIDPTFGSRILRVTDAATASGASVIPDDAGYFRTWNANATALRLITSGGTSYWVEFDASNFKVGDGSPQPALHRLNFDYSWEWSAVNPDLIYFLNGNQLAQYNKSADATYNLGGPPNGDPVTYHVTVVGQDDWVCSTAGTGAQDTYTKIFCVNPKTTESKLIDIVNRTINGVSQSDPNWPTAGSGQTLGIHSIFGSAGGTWLGIIFIGAGWGPSGEAVLNLSTDTWSLMTGANSYWSGHASLGNGKFVNGSGSINGVDSRGAIVRDPGNLMNASQFTFIMQPMTTVGWYDAEHSSWFNASTNAGAPVLFSRYSVSSPPTPLPWIGEVVAAATDGSNTVWRFAHNHNGSGAFYGQAFAQISNDGRWVLFSSYWDGTLGASSGDFGLATRIDTFIVELLPG
ncbi:MAG TPA: hypothetical protein VJ746_03095 [Nitrospira sp.]|nr:hypothetical protein [Nitrospira sp.]